MRAPELTPGGATMTSSPFRPTWSISSQAIAPKSSPHHHGQKPTRYFKNRAQTREIAVIFSNSGRQVPSPIPLSPHPTAQASRRHEADVILHSRAVFSIAAVTQTSPCRNQVPAYQRPPPLVTPLASTGHLRRRDHLQHDRKKVLQLPFSDGIAVKERQPANSAAAADFSLD
uniref:Uncharacterized protein n=1 Tax=Oryza meridionalis TaxID=40149 RepID=A0A0E0CTX2_9ORYZ